MFWAGGLLLLLRSGPLLAQGCRPPLGLPLGLPLWLLLTFVVRGKPRRGPGGPNFANCHVERLAVDRASPETLLLAAIALSGGPRAGLGGCWGVSSVFVWQMLRSWLGAALEGLCVWRVPSPSMGAAPLGAGRCRRREIVADRGHESEPFQCGERGEPARPPGHLPLDPFALAVVLFEMRVRVEGLRLGVAHP